MCVCSVCCLTLYKPTDCSPLGSSVHRIFQAGILELAAISYSREFSQPKNRTHISCVFCNGKQLLQQLGHLWEELTHWKRPWCWERLKVGREGDDRRWDGWMASLTQWTQVWANWEIVKDREAWCSAVHGVAKGQTWLRDWKTTSLLGSGKSRTKKEAYLKGLFCTSLMWQGYLRVMRRNQVSNAVKKIWFFF